MAKKEEAPPPKKKVHMAGAFLDIIGWGVREVGMPIPDTLIDALKKKKKKPDVKKK